jgi:hypothetical protein
MKTHSINP